MEKKQSALVCSGGGALGVVLLGIMHALEQKGYTFDFYAGVSAGAIITSLHAAGYHSNEIWDIIQRTNIFSLAFDFSRSNFGFLKGDKIHSILDEALEGKHFEDLDSPLWIGTTNFSNGDRVMLNKGKIADAVRASLSVPVLFQPFFHPERELWLVDGGLSQNFPLDTAIKKYQGSCIIGLDAAGGIHSEVNFAESKKFGKNIVQTLGRSFKIMFYNQQQCFPDDERVHIFAPDLSPFNTTDVFKLKKKLVEALYPGLIIQIVSSPRE